MQKVRSRRTRTLVVLMVASFAILAWGGGCNVSRVKDYLCKGEVPNRAQIIELADAKLERFCLQEAIDKNEFGESPELTFDESHKLWVVAYQSSEHFVRFMFDNCGSIETSFGPSERVTKIE
jgi:hypothetical protein